jgi:alkylated DNA repair dioxygenase AlkB
MNLFSADPVYPEGFHYYPGFITEEQEQDLCLQIQKLSLSEFRFRGYEAKRKVASYGFDYHFDSRSISPGEAIPSFFLPLMEAVADFLKLPASEFRELLVTEYPPGAVINWHRDAPPFGLIAGISLLEDCRFRLRPFDKSKQGRKSIISIPVERRSLYIMQGPVREDWEHSIMPVKERRYSITLRTLRK